MPLRQQRHLLPRGKARPRSVAREPLANPCREARSRGRCPGQGFPAAKSLWHHALEDLLARAAQTACLLIGPTPPGAAFRNRELRSSVAPVRSAGGARQDRTGASEGRAVAGLGLRARTAVLGGAALASCRISQAPETPRPWMCTSPGRKRRPG